MRFGRIQRILLRDERTVADRLQLAFIFSVLYGASAAVRILSPQQYQAIDLAFEGALIAGMLGGYVSGLVTGLCVCLPDMLTGKFMSMPLFAAAGLIGALMHDLAEEREDIWNFSPFIDLNLYHLIKQTVLLRRRRTQRPAIAPGAFNVGCNILVVLAEILRWAVNRMFPTHGTFFLFDRIRADSWLFVACMATTLFTVALPLRIWSSFRSERQLEEERARLNEAHLAALTNQINPHFLFNTLNSVSTLIRVDPARARSMVYQLSNILRRRLRKTDNFVPLREEISFIDDYLAIEMVRFGDKLRFHKQVDPEALDRLVPSMILQPIVENSIKHGLASKVDGGEVRLRIWLEGARLHISIEDNGIGIQEAELGALFNSGIGVSNVNERLRVLFGSSYRMRIASTPGEGTETLMEIPELESYVAGENGSGAAASEPTAPARSRVRS
jgi:two-component system LytT family sensor kinase